MLQTLLSYFQGPALALWGPFVVLLLCGIGFPMPEDIILATAGILSVEYSRPWFHVAALMYLGVLGGDSIIFALGHFLGPKVRRRRFVQKFFGQDTQSRVEKLFKKYGHYVLFIGRFLPGLRAPIFFSAGSVKFSFLEFLFFDGLAALISVPLFVWLGHWGWSLFESNVGALQELLGRTQKYFLLGALLFGVIAGVIIWLKKRKQQAHSSTRS